MRNLGNRSANMVLQEFVQLITKNRIIDSKVSHISCLIDNHSYKECRRNIIVQNGSRKNSYFSVKFFYRLGLGMHPNWRPRRSASNGQCRVISERCFWRIHKNTQPPNNCLLYTSDAADERSSVDLGG